MAFAKVQDIVDEELNERFGAQPAVDWASLRDFSVDWLSGVLPMEDVKEVFRTLEKLSRGRIKSSSFAVSTGGLFNYGTRLCFLGKFYFQIAYNAAPVRADTVFDGKTVHRSGDVGDFIPMSSPSKLTARERKDATAAAAVMDDWAYFSTLAGEPQQIPLRATDEGTNPGIYFSITGQGCSVLRELHMLNPLIDWLLLHDFRASRFDVAFDCYRADNPLVPMLLEGFTNTAGAYTHGAAEILTHMVVHKNLKLYRNFYPDARRESWSLSFGKHSSNSGMFRLYDKYFELISKNRDNAELLKEKGIDYWYRAEYEAHAETARALLRIYAESKHNAPLTWIRGIDCCFSPRFGLALHDARSRNPVHPVWWALTTFCLQQNDYFVQFPLEMKTRTALSYLKWLENMKKTFISLLTQMALHDTIDLDDFLRRGSEKYGGDTFLTQIFGDIDPELAEEFRRWLIEYRQKHAQRKTDPGFLEVV